MVESTTASESGLRWQRPLAAAVLAALSLCAIFLLWIIAEDLSYRGDKFDGLGAMLAGVGLGILAVVALPWAAYLRWHHRGWLYTGMASLAVLLLGIVMLGI